MNPQLLILGLTLSLGLPSLSITSDNIHSVLHDSTWSPWSPWSRCSRSCGSEGLQTRRRVCLERTGCEGRSHGWRSCVLSPCPATTLSFRDEQCAAFNNQALGGRHYLWKGAEQPDSPCTLDCLAEDQQLLHRFSSRAEDGTRCGQSGLRVCLEGECEEIGCDLELRSGARLDKCGQCGGNGSSCSQNQTYSWKKVSLSSCSVSCGGGVSMVQHQCQDLINKKPVEDEFCDQKLKPTDLFAACNEEPCPARWEVSEWSHCQSDCTGLKTRAVDCVSDLGGERLLVPDSECSESSRPQSALPCTRQDCPAWSAGAWSGCSVSCGTGVKQRSVICRNKTGELSQACLGQKPTETESCHSKCTAVSSSKGGWLRVSNNTESEETFLIKDEYNDDMELEDDEDITEQDDAENLKNIIGTNPNSSCGEGMRFRKVECKIFMEFSKTVASLPDKECPGVKPAETEICVEAPSCQAPGGQVMADRLSVLSQTLPSLNEPETLPLLLGDSSSEEDGGYIWKIAGFTTCTASCLGGLQESIVICVEAAKETPVAPYLCDPGERLEIEVRTCNENPCPPRWNVSDFSSCSQTCGGGSQTRSVHCIQEVAHGDHNIIQLEDSACPQPPPQPQQFCAVLDCPPGWEVAGWTKCSRRCGGGRRFRKVKCQQLLSLGQVIDRPESACGEAGVRPGVEEECNTQQCLYVTNPKIKAKESQNFVQSDPGQTAVKLKVGGVATVYEGTTLKISCPVRQYDKSKITWAHGSLLYHSGKKRSRHSKISVSSKGCVKIKKIEQLDEGVYTCMASKSSAKIRINVKPNPNLLTTSQPGRSDGAWLNTGTDLKDFNVKTGTDLLDQAKHSKGKWNSNKENTIGNEINFGEKPSKSDKWNHYKENDVYDEYIYWDSINNHVGRERKKTSHKDLSIATGGASNNQISFWLVISIVALQITDQFLSKSEKNKKRRKKNRNKKRRRKRPQPQPQNDGVSPLVWQSGPWSPCSKTCGGGLQFRTVQCVMRFSERNMTQDVPASFCESAKVRKPASRRSCGEESCYSWIKSPWSPCSSGDCVSRNKGIQERSVHCILDKRTIVGDQNCPQDTKPSSRQACTNTECTGVWVLGEWSQCSTTCGRGRRRRSVTCEWLAGGGAPVQECQEDRPLPTIQCYGPVCRDTWPDFSDRLEPKIILSPARDGRDTPACRDTSKFCGLIKSRKLCLSDNMNKQCCQTCKGF